ncbi:MAG: Lrp/AsnC family transcriptional regulator [Acidobacteria bacterium]|nr:Lrp/AsnC family transcriptional regulator [Acidobacteriota bacterium]
MIDATDREILKILQQNARVTNAEIARQVGMAPSAILERVRKLEARGVIQGYEVRIDPAALGLNLLAYILVRTKDFGGELRTGEELAQIAEVQEVHHIAGEDCFLVKVRVRDARTLGRLLRERFTGGGGISSTRTTIVLETLHETTRLPLDAALSEAGAGAGGGAAAAEPGETAAAAATAGDGAGADQAAALAVELLHER